MEVIDVHATEEPIAPPIAPPPLFDNEPTSTHAALEAKWREKMGPNYSIVVSCAMRSNGLVIDRSFRDQVAQIQKFKESGGLGISLEGTVDIEDGEEVRPHHYIRAILPDG